MLINTSDLARLWISRYFYFCNICKYGRSGPDRYKERKRQSPHIFIERRESADVCAGC